MKKLLLASLIIILIISLLSCNKFGQQQAKPSKANEKTLVIKGKELKGTELIAFDEQGRKQKFQIKDVELDLKDPDKETYLYTVFYQNKTDSQWKNLCQPDVNNVAKAIALSGSWDKTGKYIDSSDIFTFGCTNGALAKCVRFGYKPWKNFQGKSLRDYHQACTRMIRADYCGNGKDHTQDGTSIDVYDVLNIQKPTANDKMVFEAAWQPDGATCINHPRWFDQLSKIRQECPNKLTGRINENGSCKTAKKAQESWSSALLFNDSFVRKP
ncbi:ADYC domain-containing protein [Nostoc sp. PA-18-2419]|uniref:ADYC domain-containing protein n=1 Tax=Nostoc sp. PA-18-2419 TaxID=2575443 RepID=UPI00110963D6|nr:ADYC domain-containing protein [Nostoc sp. PA-18-2419]